MDQPESTLTPKPRSPYSHPETCHRGEAHWTVRWARARELLDDENGTGELLLELQRLNRGPHNLVSWRDGLPVAIWMFLQVPDKYAAWRQFRSQYRPKGRRKDYKPRFVPQSSGTAPPITDPELSKVVEAWAMLPDGIRSYIVSLVKPSAR